jgi:hypothetical protein
VVYFISLTSFFKTCYTYSYSTTSRLSDQITLFDDTVNTKWFIDEKVISLNLVLAHGDLLQQYLPNMTLSEIQKFPGMSQFNDQISVKKIAEYIVDLHLAKVKSTTRTVPYIYLDVKNYETVCDRFLRGNMYYRGINDPKVVHFDIETQTDTMSLFSQRYDKVMTSFTDVDIVWDNKAQSKKSRFRLFF